MWLAALFTVALICRVVDRFLNKAAAGATESVESDPWEAYQNHRKPNGQD